MKQTREQRAYENGKIDGYYHALETFIQSKQTGRDPWKTRDLARHKNIATTNRYVAELDPGEKAEIARQIEIV